MADSVQQNIGINIYANDKTKEGLDSAKARLNGLSERVKGSLNKISNNAKKSTHSLKRLIDRIGNIIMYRLIRQGLSMLVSQIQEGTKAVYIWSRAFNQLDENNIATNLDMIATKLDNIRGNLGAAWGTILANFSGSIEGALNKISDGIEKVTAFASALNGSATYARVAETNVKRYYEAVTNGLQGITVIGRVTQMEDAPIPEDIKSFAEDVKANLGDIGTTAGSLAAGMAVMLIATGHVVAGLALGGTALGIINKSNQLEDTETSSNQVKEIFGKVAGTFETIEFGLGLALIAGGKFQYGIPMVINGGASLLKKASEVDIDSELSSKLGNTAIAIETISLGLGAILCVFGEYGLGVPLLVGGLVGITEATVTNWDEIMAALQELGQKIQVWWWNLWHGNADLPWEEMVKAYDEAHLDEYAVGDKSLGFGTKQLPNLDEYLPPSSSATSKLPETTPSAFNQIGDFFGEVAEIIGSGLSNAFKGYMLRYQGPDAFADGGFPSAGSLFLAGEVPGQTELLGTINGKTGVAGGAEITGIREAIYEVGAEIISNMNNNNVNVTLEGDADGLFNVVRQKASDYTRATGNLAF